MLEDLGDEGMAEGVDTIVCRTLSKERQPQVVSELSYHQPNSRPNNIRDILSRVKAKAEELLAEEQAGFRPGRNTVEQIFNSRVVIERHLQYQLDLFHNFRDFGKTFDRV